MYRCAVVDPPWLERGAGKVRRGADRHYPLMRTAEIFSLLEREIAPQLALDCHLWLWVTNNFLRAGLDVIDRLAFRYVTNLVWVKDRIGLGQYLRGQHELCLFAVRGSALMPELRNTSSVVFCAKGPHSFKPTLAYDAIAAVSPSPRLDVFAREPRPGFDAWGNDIRETLFARTA